MGLREKIIGLAKTKIDGICSNAEFKQLIEKERCRADRNDHHYSMLVFILNPEEVKKHQLVKSLERIRRRLRNIDEIGWYEEKKLGIILPYTSKEGAEKLAEDICEMIEPRTCCSGCEVYTYSSPK